ncbi:bifunctional hydroxymethylpyrimidine kinase/phosphomethylpyrimidine kinase [Sphingosinicella sp. LHD-64]|uniref:bifunctional hydroxymethylpyrimidine kinase/phosphomethylpyrimidine kinase n=1 Tax=Sphingosinicella sp. LHD-64 TaxID=3072139 RepID=UPI00280CB579|nr:bifunctional hydroxymethylpyrimidine kinase/phosphomethylpyrimidine kinase [Sphingosinicella sp. LHD-64]MDQ8757915.1 bifunctional hydroxymethylpyrimidine kinase/phosphomethylpyrimidine kinase [Sphingosinicella sp. LHD-64]
MKTPRILIIAGSDSGGGAGIQADIKTVTMLGGHAMTAVTAITAQNTLGVQAVLPIPAEMVIAQIDSVVSDIGVDAVKIGMIGSPEIANAVADRLEHLAAPIVFDPVMVATSGSVLADAATVTAFGRLMRLASVVTPNTPELEKLSGTRIETFEDRYSAAEILILKHGCRAVLAKGGHFPGIEIQSSDIATGETRIRSTEDELFDALFFASDEGQALEVGFSHPRIQTRHTHGTGCTLASAIAVGLARDYDLDRAVMNARDYVQATLRAAPGFGAGHGPIGHALGEAPFDLIHRKDN